MSQWGDSIVWDMFKGDERMGTHNHENMPHGNQIWKLEFAEQDEDGTIYWFVVNHYYPAKRLALWKNSSNDFKAGTQDKGLEYGQMWTFVAVEGRSETYLIKNREWPNRVWRKWGEDDEEVGTDTIEHAKGENRFDECYWKISSIMNHPNIGEDEIFRYDNHLDRPSTVTAEIIYGASTSTTTTNSLSISASIKAAFSTESTMSQKGNATPTFKGKASGFGIDAKIGFTQAFDWTTSRRAYYSQSSKFKITVGPGKSVRLYQPVLTLMNNNDKENILVVRSQTFRRRDEDIVPVNELIDEQTEEQNAETNETEAFHILEHGALFTITNAGRNTDNLFEMHIIHIGDINVGYGCWGQNVLVTSLRCWRPI